MNNRVLFVALASIIYFCVPSYEVHYAYVLKFSSNEADQLVRFDADKNEVLDKITAPADSGWNNFLVPEKGGCYVSSFRKDVIYGRDIYYYDPGKGGVEHYLNLGNIFGPSNMALTEREMIVQVVGRSGEPGSSGGVVFLDRKKKMIIAEVYIPRKDYTQADVNYMYFDGDRYLALASFYMPPRAYKMDKWLQTEYTGDIFIIDINRKNIVKTIEIPRQYKCINCVLIVKDKIYAAATYNGRMSRTGECTINNELLVFSLLNGRLIKKIKVDGFPFFLVHDKGNNKVYVLHRNERAQHSTIEVINPVKDSIIKRLIVPDQLMASMVAPNKMYITAGNAQFENRSVPSKLYVIDTRTDKIIKEFEGIYTGISINPKY